MFLWKWLDSILDLTKGSYRIWNGATDNIINRLLCAWNMSYAQSYFVYLEKDVINRFHKLKKCRS